MYVLIGPDLNEFVWICMNIIDSLKGFWVYGQRFQNVSRPLSEVWVYWHVVNDF